MYWKSIEFNLRTKYFKFFIFLFFFVIYLEYLVFLLYIPSWDTFAKYISENYQV